MYVGKAFKRKNDASGEFFTVLDEQGDLLVLDTGARCKISTLNENYVQVDTIDPTAFFNTSANALRAAADGRTVSAGESGPSSPVGMLPATSQFLNDARGPQVNEQHVMHQQQMLVQQQQQNLQPIVPAGPAQQPMQAGPPPIGQPLVGARTYAPQAFAPADYEKDDPNSTAHILPITDMVQPGMPYPVLQPGQRPLPAPVAEAAEIAIFRRVKRGQNTTLKLSVDVEVPTPTAGATMDDMFELSYVDFLTDEIMMRMSSDRDFLRQHVRDQIDVYINGVKKKKRSSKQPAPVAAVVVEAPKPKRAPRPRKRKEAEAA